MVSNAALKTTEVNLLDIYLDPNNPRFFEESSQTVPDKRIVEDSVQERAYETMRKNHDVDSLADSIENMGFLRIHRIVVRPIDGRTDAYVVVEGNRRVSACKYLHKKHLEGKELDPEVLASILSIEVLVYGGDDHTIAWDIQGINHLTGIRPWAPYNQAYHLVQKMEDEGLTLKSVAQRFGLTAHAAGRMVRAFYGLRALKSDEEFAGCVKNSHYSYFEEVFKKPVVRKWLGWDEKEKQFSNVVNRERFYKWFLPDDGAAKKLPMAIDVRKLPPIVEDPALTHRFDNELTLEDALQEAGKNAPPAGIEGAERALRSARSAIDGITAVVLREHGEKIKLELEDLIRVAKDAVDRCRVS